MRLQYEMIYTTSNTKYKGLCIVLQENDMNKNKELMNLLKRIDLANKHGYILDNEEDTIYPKRGPIILYNKQQRTVSELKIIFSIVNVSSYYRRILEDLIRNNIDHLSFKYDEDNFNICLNIEENNKEE